MSLPAPYQSAMENEFELLEEQIQAFMATWGYDLEHVLKIIKSDLGKETFAEMYERIRQK